VCLCTALTPTTALLESDVAKHELLSSQARCVQTAAARQSINSIIGNTCTHSRATRKHVWVPQSDFSNHPLGRKYLNARTRLQASHTCADPCGLNSDAPYARQPSTEVIDQAKTRADTVSGPQHGRTSDKAGRHSQPTTSEPHMRAPRRCASVLVPVLRHNASDYRQCAQAHN
jgi:hypothetical protein